MTLCLQSPWVWLRRLGDALAVVGRAEALGVADHVAHADPEAAAQVLGQVQRGVQLAAVAEHVGVAEADVLDPDRGPVEADGVAAAGAQVDELEDPPGGADDEVAADVGQLVQLGVGDVGGEGVADGGGAAGDGDVLDDHVRVAQAPGVVRRSGARSRRPSGACASGRRGSATGRSAGAAARGEEAPASGPAGEAIAASASAGRRAAKTARRRAGRGADPASLSQRG